MQPQQRVRDFSHDSVPRAHFSLANASLPPRSLASEQIRLALVQIESESVHEVWQVSLCERLHVVSVLGGWMFVDSAWT